MCDYKIAKKKKTFLSLGRPNIYSFCFENRKKLTNGLCGQNGDIINVTAGGTSS
jgi:hypothetical protein